MKRRSLSRAKSSFNGQSLSGGIAIPFLEGSVSGLIGIALILFIFSAVSPQSFSVLRMSAADTAAPVIDVVTKPLRAMADTMRNVSGLSELQAENARLTQENVKLKEWYQTALLLEAENKSLKDLLNVKIEPSYKTITARIMADPGNAFVKSFIVNAGANDGVQKGQAVMSGEGLIGRVIEVGENSARVLLITDVNSRVPVIVEDTRQHAIMAGTNKDITTLNHLPADSDIKDGARVVTSGQGGVFPPGLAIGRIQKNEKGGVNLLPFSDFNRIFHVRIIDKGQDANSIVEPLNIN